jgi:rod shape-determining protein MreC
MASQGRRLRLPPLRLISLAWPWLLVLGLLVGLRLSKGAGVLDVYALLSRPFWPGSAQSEWLTAAQRIDRHARLQQLEADNQRLRGLLDLERGNPGLVSAPVISRQAGGWWQQVVIGRGGLQGLAPGDAVLAPGGLLGRVASVTPTTATVLLLTDSSSRIGVWVGRAQRHGLLVGAGTSRPVLRFIEQDVGVRCGHHIAGQYAPAPQPHDRGGAERQRAGRARARGHCAVECPGERGRLGAGSGAAG